MSKGFSLLLPSTPAERIVAAIAAPFVMLLGVVCYHSTGRVFGRGGPDLPSKILDTFFAAGFHELSLGFILFGSLVFAWSVFRFSLAERLLLFIARSVWHALIIFTGGFIVCFLIVQLVAAK